MTFIPGLQLARRFFHDIVAPRLERLVPGLAYGAALIGDGSEVLGYDDVISVDHDWGPRVQIFVRPEDVESAALAVMPETQIGRIGPPSPRTVAPLRHPEWFEGNREQRLARLLGVTQFGVNHLTLEPGAYSALRHWHEQEDEFVFVLESELVLIDDNGEHRLTAGMYAAFTAGEANAHHLCNRSSSPARFLAIITRHRGAETLHYPDDALAFDGPLMRDEKGDRMPSR